MEKIWLYNRYLIEPLENLIMPTRIEGIYFDVWNTVAEKTRRENLFQALKFARLIIKLKVFNYTKNERN